MTIDDTNPDAEASSERSSSGSDRRSLLKAAGAAASAGALGSLAGCAGGGGQSTPTPKRVVETRIVKETVEGEERTVVKTKVVTQESQQTATQGAAVVNWWSARAVERPNITAYFREQLREFEEVQNGEIIVNMQGLSYSQLKTKYATTVAAGAGIPDLAESGTFGLEQWHNGNVLEMGPYVEETEGFADKMADAVVEAAQYRGTWWSAGCDAVGSTQFGILTEPFKQVGISDPHEDLKTWTQVRRAFDKIQNQKPGNVQFAHEVTGTTFDVEAYWGKARTAYTGGTDPWLDVSDKGSNDKPHIKVDGEPKTDGMILNNIDLGQKYSSPKHPTRGDEQVYPLMVQGTVASQMYGMNTQAFLKQNPDAEFGWNGVAMGLPAPKLDPNYGEEFGVEDLAGVEGQHGGHTWSLERMQTMQKATKVPDAAWTFYKYRITDERFLIPWLVDPNLWQDTAAYQPILELQQKSKYKDMRLQPFENALSMVDQWGTNYRTTGANWDVPGTNNIRWKDLGTTLSKAYAGEFPREQAPAKIKQEIVNTLNDNDVQPANP